MIPAEMVEKYIALRDHKKNADAEFKKSMERVNNAMEILEGQMLKHLDDTGATSIACAAGTVYRNTQFSATVEDRAEFFAWLQQSGEWEAADIKANKTYIRASVEEGDAVPGVKHTAVYTVGVRRS